MDKLKNLENCSFASSERLLEHVCDHVLTRPEAHDWAMIMSELSKVVNVGCDESLFAAAQELWNRTPSVQVARIPELYEATIKIAIRDAIRLGMWWETNDRRCEWLGLGLDGTFVVVWKYQTVKTAYLPHNSALPRKAKSSRSGNPLPRRDRGKLLRKPPKSSEALIHELYKSSHRAVSNLYHKAYYKQSITDWGGNHFAQRPFRFQKWKKELATRITNI